MAISIHHLFLLSYCSLIFPFVTLADKAPIKSINDDGHVTYADQPVAGAKSIKKIPIEAQPSASEIDAAQQQAKKRIELAEKIDKANKAKREKRIAKKNQRPKPAPPAPTDTNMYYPYSGGWPRPPLYHPPVVRPPMQKPPAHRPPGIRPPPIPGSHNR